MLNTLNTHPLEQHRLFRSRDIDEAHQKIAKNVSPHRVNVLSNKELLDVNFKGIRLDQMMLVQVYYGAPVEVQPEQNNYYFTQTTVTGSGQVTLGKEQCGTAIGETVVVSPSVPYKMRLQEHCKRIAVAIDPVELNNHLSKLINSEIRHQPVFDLKPKNAQFWLNTINYVITQISNEPAILKSKNIQRAYTNIIISNLLELHNHNYKEQMSAKEDYMLCPQIKSAVDYIQDNIKNIISITDLAGFSNVSVRTLQRNFTRHMGITPAIYIRNTKLDAIHQELESLIQLENGTIKRILLDYGISDFGRFAQYYRERFGCTPNETLSRTIQNIQS